MNTHGSKPPTINDVAEVAGVSSITVSRVFTSPEKVKAKTRERIMKVADEMGYIHNVFAQNIKTVQSPIIGIIADDTFNQSYSYVIQELCKLSETRGYSVMIFTTQGERTSEAKAINTLVGYKAAGIVLSVISDSADYDTRHLKVLNGSHTRLIQFDRQFDEQLPAVYVNDRRAGELIASVVNDKAYKKVLVIGGPKDSRITQKRLTSICENLSDNIEVTRLYADYRYDHAKEIITSHFSSNEIDYDAIIGINGAISLAAKNVATRWMLRGVEFLSIDEIPNAEDYGFYFCCVVHDYKQWATIVAENLIAAIEDRPWQERTMINGFLKNNQ